MATLLSLRDLLQHEIDDLYSAEEQIIAALPKMIEKATDRELKKALTDHLKVTRAQKDRLDKVRAALGEKSEESKGFFQKLFGSTMKCKGTEGLIQEGEKMMSEDMDPKVMDAAIIASAQKIEHYEISGYGTARAFARELGLSTVQKLLEATLAEEYEADDSLTVLALNKVNVEADNSDKSRRGNAVSPASRKTTAPKKSAPSKTGSAKAAPKKVAKKTAPKKAAKKKTARR